MSLHVKWYWAFLIWVAIWGTTDSYAQCPQRYRNVVFNRLKLTPNVIYGGNKAAVDGTRTWLAMDFYEPADDTATLRPFIVLMHAGGFNRNVPLTRKTIDVQVMAKNLARRGYVVISPEYRLFTGEVTFPKFAKTFGAAFFDIHEMMCFLQQSVENGNPYKLDTGRFFMGGISAGGLIALNFGAFTDETADIPQPYRNEFLEMAALDNIDLEELLGNKFCGIRPKGIFSVSAALLDTLLIQPTDAVFYLMHGAKDTIVPFLEGYPLSDPSFPDVFGPGVFAEQLSKAGIDYSSDVWPEGNHTPHVFPFAADPIVVIQQLLEFGGIFVEEILDSTINQMANIAYRKIGSPQNPCIVTGTNQQIIQGALKVYPNPSLNDFIIELPTSFHGEAFQLSIFNMAGGKIIESTVTGIKRFSVDLSIQPPGTYFLSLIFPEGGEIYMEHLVRL